MSKQITAAPLRSALPSTVGLLSARLLAVQTYLSELLGVAQVHDLHIWGMSTTEIALTAHLVIPEGHPGDAFLAKVTQDLHDRFGIEHATLQVETGIGDNICPQISCSNR